MRGRKCAERGVALGDQRAAVEHRARLPQHGAASNSSTVQPMATAWWIVSANRARASSSPRQSIASGTPSRIGVMTDTGAVVDGPASTSSTVAASATVVVNAETQSKEAMAGTTPSLGRRARRGLQADQPTQRGGDPSRTGGVGPQRERHLAARHRHRRPRARTPGDVLGHRGGCDTVRTAVTGCRPGRWRTGRGWSCPRRRRRRRAGAAPPVAFASGTYAKAGQAAVVGKPRDVDVVLHRERHAGQGEVGPRGEPGVDLGDPRPQRLRCRRRDPCLGAARRRGAARARSVVDGRPAGGHSSATTTRSGVPAATRSPTAHTTRVTVPPIGARHRRLGLHRLERDHARRPAPTRSPAATSTRATPPCSGASTTNAPSGSAPRSRSDRRRRHVDRFRVPGELAGGFPSRPAPRRTRPPGDVRKASDSRRRGRSGTRGARRARRCRRRCGGRTGPRAASARSSSSSSAPTGYQRMRSK